MSTKIQWTEETWNPIVGCSKVSDGCKNCYAIRMAHRLAHMPHMKEVYGPTVTKTAGGAVNWTGVISESHKAWFKPLWTKKPTMYFVNSMSDLFHPGVTMEQIAELFAVMYLAGQHTYQVLTKRAETLVMLNTPEFYEAYRYSMEKVVNLTMDGAAKNMYIGSLPPWPLKNVWLGVSVENQKAADERIPLLLQVPAAVRWLSCEPMTGPVDLTWLKAPEDDDAGASRINTLTGYRSDMARPCRETNKIDWVVCGGESGPNSRPMHPDWAREVRDQCKGAGVPFFFKQWGTYADGSNWPAHRSGPVTGHITVLYNGEYQDIDSDVLLKKYSPREWAELDPMVMHKAKKNGPALLDGVEHKEYPVIK